MKLVIKCHTCTLNYFKGSGAQKVGKHRFTQLGIMINVKSNAAENT